MFIDKNININIRPMLNNFLDSCASDLWAAKLNLRGRASLATAEELSQYERKKEEMDIELERRKMLGEQYLVWCLLFSSVAILNMNNRQLLL